MEAVRSESTSPKQQVVGISIVTHPSYRSNNESSIMQFIIVALGFLSLLPFTFAQGLSGLPACAESCALNAIGGSGCPVSNTTCICDSATFISSYTACVGTSCNATDAAAATQFGIQYCAAAGVTLSPPASIAAATSAPASTEGPATTAGATTAPSATAVTTASEGQSGSPTSTTPAVSSFKGAAQPLALGNTYGWMVAGIGLAGGLVVAQL